MFLRMLKCLLIIVDINLSLLPLAGWNLALEHNINLAVRTTSHLRKLEVRDNKTEQSSTTPDVPAFAAN